MLNVNAFGRFESAGVSAVFCRIFGLKSGPDGSGQPSGFIWTKFQAKRSILDPIRAIFDDLGPMSSVETG